VWGFGGGGGTQQHGHRRPGMRRPMVHLRTSVILASLPRLFEWKRGEDMRVGSPSPPAMPLSRIEWHVTRRKRKVGWGRRVLVEGWKVPAARRRETTSRQLYFRAGDKKYSVIHLFQRILSVWGTGGKKNLGAGWGLETACIGAARGHQQAAVRLTGVWEVFRLACPWYRSYLEGVKGVWNLDAGGGLEGACVGAAGGHQQAGCSLDRCSGVPISVPLGLEVTVGWGECKELYLGAGWRLEDACVGAAGGHQQAAVGQPPDGLGHQLQGGDVEQVHVLQDDEDGAVLVYKGREHQQQQLLHGEGSKSECRGFKETLNPSSSFCPPPPPAVMVHHHAGKAC